jgi:hypothetical protein
MSYTPENDDALADRELKAERAADMTNVPGIFLIGIGVINLLLSLFLLHRTYDLAVMTVEDYRRQLAQVDDVIRPRFPAVADLFAETAKDPEAFKQLNVLGNGIWGGVGLVAALLVLFAGVRMRALRSWGLSVTGAVVVAVPFLSCLGCCGVGEAIGLWALIVLLNSDVKAAFR